MPLQVKIENMPAIRAAFMRAPYEMTKNLNVAIKRSALTVEGTSKRFTPVRTGRLRSSHYTRTANLKGTVGTNTNYDMFVHFGTRFMKARPFLADALDVQNGFIQAEFETAVEKTLKTIARSA